MFRYPVVKGLILIKYRITRKLEVKRMMNYRERLSFRYCTVAVRISLLKRNIEVI